jgi:UDP-N-acetylglucosamine/UDP-N-acetylgalactosamine diphosphorylase
VACYQGIVSAIEARLQDLAERGAVIVDPRQTWVDDAVDPSRIQPGAILHPGTRLSGGMTFLGEGAEVGREGPATLVDAVLDAGARVDSGFVQGAVLLSGARAGANAHLRDGTLLEERASTAHAVGLKHTILLSFVTLGSLINFCDCLMAGGTSRADHSEVGSGYIHFNFTPWGERGDKATPSRFGDVPRGVFLRERRIFLGGTGGTIGPRQVGFGVVAAAGQVLRDDVADGRLVTGQRARITNRELDPDHLDVAEPRASRNREYVGQLVALREWYRQVRRARERRSERADVLDAAIGLLGRCIDERVDRLARFLAERGQPVPSLHLEGFDACPLVLDGGPEDHVDWVRNLSDEDVAHGTAWLRGIIDVVAG